MFGSSSADKNCVVCWKRIQAADDEVEKKD